jgi:hypothetical protein
MLRRMAALAFAGLVLAIAFSIRASREDGRAVGSEPGGPADVVGGPPAENPYEVFEEGSVSLLCAEELGELCGDLSSMNLGVRAEPAWVTAARLRDGGELGADAWLTIRPFDEVVTAAALRLGARTGVLARTPVVLTGTAAAMAQLRAECPDVSSRFACATAPERVSSVALHDPHTSALGALTLTTVVHELGIDDTATAIDDPAVAAQLATVLDGARRTQSPLQDAERIGGRMVALTVEAELLARLDVAEYDDRERVAGGFGVDYPIDVRAVEVVAAAHPDFRRFGDLDRVLRSRGVGYAFERSGYLPAERDSYVLDLEAFAERPVVRTDLRFSTELLEAVRSAAG